MELPWQSRKLDEIFPAEAGKVIQSEKLQLNWPTMPWIRKENQNIIFKRMSFCLFYESDLV